MSPVRLRGTTRRQLRALTADVADAPDLRSAAAMLAERVSTILDGPVSVERRSPAGALVFSGTPAGRAPEAPPVPQGAEAVAGAEPTEAPAEPWPLERAEIPLGTHGGADWVLVLPGRPETARDEEFLQELGTLVGAALAAPALREAAGRTETVVATAYTFARRLTRLHGTAPLPQFIIDSLAEAAHADLGALAVYDETAGHLRIAATHGYPAVLVEHVRVLPGQGVIGRVHDTRRPMLVTNLEGVGGLHTRRPRYKTGSFLAVPLLANGEVLGVASLADRQDGRPFDKANLTAVRALAAPAALALLNDRLAHRTRELAHAATIDPLTGLFNRRYFETRIEEEMERARRYAHDLALLIADIDNFKQLNDQLGHLAGDFLLKQVADILKRAVRVFDVCTRIGGEEFAILMPRSDITNGLMVAERIRQRVESASREAGPLPAHLRVTISLGLTVLRADTAPQALIARADRALYRAKADGKNCVRVEE